ncbi:MFS transporter [Ferrimonas aestuarii]|uniref:MFS transporter n=1 Tax=Ferrimonas aestuarii TaxID=2569539 RepID=A0A4U1BL27_9GAMM|nr:MFS transporter [Ferrimonas aestuarii]TKB53062.1 MFS transporter [Ferrimonas aestuarii]
MSALSGRQYTLALSVLIFSAMVVFCNLYVAQPMLPLLAQQFGLDSAHANWMHAATPLALAIALIPWAMLSDSWGRRPIMLLSLASLPVINLLLIHSQSAQWFIGLRLIHGVMLAGFVAVAAAWISEEVGISRLASAMGTYVAANAIGGLGGRLIGGASSLFGHWQAPFWILIAISIAAGIALWLLLPKQRNFTPTAPNLRLAIQGLKHHLSNPLLRGAYLIGGITFGLFVNLYTVLGFQLAQAPWSLTAAQLSLLFLTYLAGSVSAQFSGRWLRYFSAPAGLQTGALFLIFGTVITLADSIEVIILGLLLCSIGFFQVHSLAYSWVGQHAQFERAKASSLYLVHYYLGASLGGFVLLPIWSWGGWPMVVVSCLLGYGLIIVLAHYIHRHAFTQRTHA